MDWLLSNFYHEKEEKIEPQDDISSIAGFFTYNAPPPPPKIPEYSMLEKLKIFHENIFMELQRIYGTDKANQIQFLAALCVSVLIYFTVVSIVKGICSFSWRTINKCMKYDKVCNLLESEVKASNDIQEKMSENLKNHGLVLDATYIKHEMTLNKTQEQMTNIVNAVDKILENDAKPSNNSSKETGEVVNNADS